MALLSRFTWLTHFFQTACRFNELIQLTWVDLQLPRRYPAGVGASRALADCKNRITRCKSGPRHILPKQRPRMITLQRLKEVVSYDPESGESTWRICNGGAILREGAIESISVAKLRLRLVAFLEKTLRSLRLSFALSQWAAPEAVFHVPGWWSFSRGK